ncbi:MAG: hypothetical protein HC847_02285 [Hydrococcus sp. RU_2_2]|nr:hypothetical protein [Hydrococcus sp. RU_2_2]
MSKLARSRKFWNCLSKEFKLFIIIILLVSIFFRFVNINKKYYWIDETVTSLRISGYLKEEVNRQVFTGSQISVRELARYQTINSEKNIFDTVKGLAKEEAQLPPLYFILVRLWTQLFGNSIAVTRSLSAFISLLAFPCVYWLCLELFNSPLIGVVAVMLVAVSPFQVLYAQEARMYSLWSVQILLTSAVFLRAIRLNTKFSWFFYSLSIVLGLYTHLLSILVAIAQGIYLVIIEKFRVSKKIVSYLISCFTAILLFSPWIFTILNHSSGAKAALAWLDKTAKLQENLISFVNNIFNAIIDFWFVYNYFPNLNFPNLRFGIYIKPLLLILMVYSFYFIYRKTSIKIWLFILTLTFVPPLLIVIRDINANSGSLSQARYLIPCYLGISIAIAYLFATQIKNKFRNLWQKKFWYLSTILLISFGILSCAISSQAETWSNKYGMNYYPVVRAINQCERPLLMSDRNLVLILSLSHYLDPKVKLQLLPASKISVELIDQLSRFSDIFLFQPSDNFQQTFKTQLNYKIISLKEIRELLKIEKSND